MSCTFVCVKPPKSWHDPSHPAIDYWQALVYAPVTALIGMAVAWHENPAVAPELLSLAALQASVRDGLAVWLASRPWAMLVWFDRSSVLIRMALLTGYGAALVNLTVCSLASAWKTSGLSVAWWLAWPWPVMTSGACGQAQQSDRSRP